jgi:exodeoxyribonuclease VII small subunit
MSKKQFIYKNSIAEIEEIINKLENEEIDLDNLSENVKRASELILKCKENLRQSEEDIEKIIKTIQSGKPV